MSNSPNEKTERHRSHKPKTPAQRASEANNRQQIAINTHAPRPSDRQMGEQPGIDSGKQTRVAGGATR